MSDELNLDAQDDIPQAPPVEHIAEQPVDVRDVKVEASEGTPGKEGIDRNIQPQLGEEVEAGVVEFPRAVQATLDNLNERIDQIGESFVSVQTRLAGLESALELVAKQVSFLPPQMRMLSSKVTDLTYSISEPRYREVLLSLLGIYDLVDQLLRTLPAEEDENAAQQRRNYEVLATQLRQVLEMNGLFDIKTDGPFDPNVHRALQCVPCDDPAQHDHIVDVVRRGFRTERSILRYAEVVVGRWELNETGDEALAQVQADDVAKGLGSPESNEMESERESTGGQM
jgi:hypothetical protein